MEIRTICKLISNKNILLSLFALIICYPVIAEEREKLTGIDIVKRCGHKYQGDDQRSNFEVLLIDNAGNIKRSVYTRIWKDYKQADNIEDKMMLFSEFPPDAKGAAFMRITYKRELHQNADQWIYLPVLKMIRRVTIRDPGDSFLNSELTYADVEVRGDEEDNHQYIGEESVGALKFYKVESVPKEGSSQYSKRLQWFMKGESWDDCAIARIDYFDKKDSLLKEQYIKWQKVNDAWIWERVLVRNQQTKYQSVFLISDVEVNSGIKDELFSDRTLRLGLDAVSGKKAKNKENK